MDNLEFVKNIKFNEKGLVPAIAQDVDTGEVLMLAYMNKESLLLTLETGYCVYYSRSREKLWKKGETSGHVQRVVSIHYDCDGDTVLVIVEQQGSACHTGNRTCFFSPEKPETVPCSILIKDYAVIKDRKANPDPESYTNYLFDKGVDKICKKIGEESSEVIIAAKNNDPHELTCEISDLLYHLMVLMVNNGVEWDDIFEELYRRQGMKSEKVKKLRKSEENKG